MITDVADSGGKFVYDLAPLAVDINLVDPDPNNVNVHPDWQIEELRKTLREYGQHKPLVVNEKNGRLICRIGNGTLEAARREGWSRVAVVRVSEAEQKLKARAIRDNTAPWGSQFDDAELRRQLGEIKKFDVDLAQGLGWNESELAFLLSKSDNSYLSKALSSAQQQNDETLEEAKTDEDFDEILDDEEEEASEEKYNLPKPQPLPNIIDHSPTRIVVSALQAAEFLSMMPGVSAELLKVFCDLYNPAVFEAVYDSNQRFVKVSCRVPINA
jgi:hypothetical protein